MVGYKIFFGIILTFGVKRVIHPPVLSNICSAVRLDAVISATSSNLQKFMKRSRHKKMKSNGECKKGVM